MSRAEADLAVFEQSRPRLIALAYRMLGDVARAQELVQEAWLRWHHRADDDVRAPVGFLITLVTRLCLTELDSARARHEESRGDRLPEPADLAQAGMDRLERLEQISMAFLVVLERLTPAERAVLLLHDVFELPHDEIAALVARSPAATRKLLERARRDVTRGRRMLTASRDEHARLLQAFVDATTAGDPAALIALLADDAVLITDGGSAGNAVGRTRNLPHPLAGAARVAGFVTAVARGPGASLTMEPRVLNGQPAVVLRRDGHTVAALLLAVADGRIQRVFFHADQARLGFVG